MISWLHELFFGVVIPQQAEQLMFDWNAAAGRTMNGNKVVTWTDQVGGVVLSQPNDAERGDYIGAEYSVKFTEAGATNYTSLTYPGNIAKPYSMVVCLKRGANNTIFPSATVRYAICNDTAHGLSKYSWTTNPVFQCGTPGNEETGLLEDGNYHVVIRTFDIDGNATVYKDTVQSDYTQGATDYSGPTWRPIMLGGEQNTGAGNFWIRRLQYYSGVISQATIAQLQIDLMPEIMDIPNITTTSLPVGTQGSAYSQQLAATGDGTITWDVIVGDLPGGLTLSPTGLLSSANITASGAFAFTVEATSEWGSDTQAYLMTVNPEAPSGEPEFIGPNIADQAWDTEEVVSLDVSAKFTGASTYELVPPWPLGLTISSGGVISGTLTTEEFVHPRGLVKAINANGVAISNPFEVSVLDPTPPITNMIHNSRFLFADTAQDYTGPWGFQLAGMTGATMTKTYQAATGGYEIEITTPATANINSSLRSLFPYSFVAGVKYTMMAECIADAANTYTQTPLEFESAPGFQQWSATAAHQIAPGQTKRVLRCFSFTGNVSTSLYLMVRTSGVATANKLKIKNFQLVQGEYLTEGSLPAYVPTYEGISTDGTYITFRDNGTIGRTVPTTHFGFDGLWWGMPEYAYSPTLALANANNKYYSPVPVAPRLEAGLIRIWQRWGNCEVSDGVFDWTQVDQYGRAANRLPQVCSIFGVPFIMVVGLGPPLFRPGWRPSTVAPYYTALVKDFTALNAYVDALLNDFVPMGLVGLELNGEPSEGFWGERDTVPGTTAEWRAASAVFARLAKIIHDRINVYNAAHGTTIRLHAPGDNHNFSSGYRFSSPGFTAQHGPGFLEASDGASGIGLDHLDAISFHGYYSIIDTGMRVIKTIAQNQKWCKDLGRPNVTVWCSEGLGKDETPLRTFATLTPFNQQIRYMLGVQGAMVAFDSVGFCHYAWDHNGGGFYGSLSNPPQPPEADHTENWVQNYEALEVKWNALKALVTTGGRKVYAARIREADMIIEILVGTTRGGATWYAMDETFTGA